QSDDALDALVAAIVARTAWLDACETIPEHHRQQALNEGWIALPFPGTFELLAVPDRMAAAAPVDPPIVMQKLSTTPREGIDKVTPATRREDPSMAERCKHGIDRRFCSLCSGETTSAEPFRASTKSETI